MEFSSAFSAFSAVQLNYWDSARTGHMLCHIVSQQEFIMGIEDIAAGKSKQIRGKANDIAGAVTGNTRQQIKGKVQKAVGKAQESFGRESTRKSNSNR